MLDKTCNTEKSHFSSRTAKSIHAFCSEYGIAVATFYRNIESMPKTIRIGRQIRILKEDEKAWLAQAATGPNEFRGSTSRPRS